MVRQSAPFENCSIPGVFEDSGLLQSRAELAKAGDFYTPPYLIRFLAGLVEPRGGDIYDPCCGSGSLLVAAALACAPNPVGLYGQTLNADARNICQANLALHGVSADLGSRPANTLLEDLHPGRRFSYIFANVPFNMKQWYGEEESAKIAEDPRWKFGLPPRSNANFAWLQHILSHLEEDGRAVVILPNGALSSQNAAERKIRENILRGRRLECVIALPGGLFYNTKVPCNVWIVTGAPSPRESVLLVNASQLRRAPGGGLEESALRRVSDAVRQHRAGTLKPGARTSLYAAVSLEELEQKRFSLSPNLYTALEKLPSAPTKGELTRFLRLAAGLEAQLPEGRLKELIALWRSGEKAGHWTRAPLTDLYEISSGLKKGKEFFGSGTPIAGPRDIIPRMFLEESMEKRVQASPKELCKYDVRRRDILMNRTSENIPKLACCSAAVTDLPVVFGNYTMRLRPREGCQVNSLYAAGYFRSALYRREVEKVSPVYTTRANMTVERLADISLYYPDPETQERLGQTFLALSRFRRKGRGAGDDTLEEFVRLLIEQQITYPVQSCLEGGGL